MAHFFITGHTGFKGTWLSALLSRRGHKVSGYSVKPESTSLAAGLSQSGILANEFQRDIRDLGGLEDALSETKPDFVIHLAAQPLVSVGFRNPSYTYDVNFNGTRNVLQAVDRAASVKAQLIVTTDKVYRASASEPRYREDDALGGLDPYSCSKAAADLLAQEYSHRRDSVPTSIARAGNVLGAGDYSEGRLLPDLVRGVLSANSVSIRHAKFVRPWQHVLDCLQGYLVILEDAFRVGRGNVWNVSPPSELLYTVEQVVERAKTLRHFETTVPESSNFEETPVLQLNSAKLENELGWRQVLNFDETIEWAMAEVLHASGVGRLREIMDEQISAFELRLTHHSQSSQEGFRSP